MEDQIDILVNDVITTTGARDDSSTRFMLRERLLSFYHEVTRDLRDENKTLMDEAVRLQKRQRR